MKPTSKKKVKSTFFAPIKATIKLLENAVALIDPNNNIVLVNEFFCDLIGYKEDDLIGRNISELMHGNAGNNKSIDVVNDVNEKSAKHDWRESRWRHQQGHIVNVLYHIDLLNLDADFPPHYLVQVKPNHHVSIDSHPVHCANANNIAFQNLSPDPFFSFDLNGNLTHVNGAAAQLAEYSQKELLKAGFTGLCSFEDRELFSRYFSKVHQGRFSNFEISITTQKGNKRQLSLTFFPVISEGILTGFYCNAKDITSQKQEEEDQWLLIRIYKLFETESTIEECLHSALVEISSYCDIEVSEACMLNTKTSNPNICTKYLASETLQTIDYQIDLSWKLDLFQKVLKTKQPFLQQIGLLKKNTNTREEKYKQSHLSACVIPIVFKEKVLALFSFYAYDLKQCQNACRLFESVFIPLADAIQKKKDEEVLKRFFKITPHSLIITDRESFIKRMNNSFKMLLGYKKKDILSKPFLSFIHPEDLHATKDCLDQLSEQNPTIQLENRYLTKDGQVKWIAWTYSLAFEDDLIFGIGREITEAKNLQQAVAREKERFSDMFNSAPVTMCILKGKDLVFENANELYYQFSGRRNIIGKRVREVFPEAEGQGIFELMTKVLQTGEIYSVNERLVQLDVKGKGVIEDFYLSFMFQPYRNAEGTVEGIFYFGVDVTEQVKARKKIEESKKQYVDLIQNLPAAIYTCNTSGDILLYNKAAVTLWGREPKEGKDKWCGSWQLYNDNNTLIPHELSPMAMSLKKGRAMRNVELKIKRPDDTIRRIVAFPSSVFDTSGHLTGGMNIMIDITDRKNAEEELNKLSLIAKKTINAVIISNREGKIEWVNDAFTHITGYSFLEVIGKKPGTLLHGENTDRKTIRWMIEKMRKGESFECELLKYTKSSKPFWMEIQAQPLFDTKGKLVAYFQIETDITERKTTYENLVKKENEIRTFARQLNKVLEEERCRIAREIHDEFGQQLTGLKMSLSSLKNQDAINLETGEMVNELMSDVEKSIRALRSIATELRPGILDTLGLIPSIEWLAKQFEKKTGINTVLKILNRDRGKNKELAIVFFRVCQEALTNISKHAGASKVEISINHNRNELSLKIKDNGKGINREKLEDPFSMGLTAMRERANLINGQLKIRSKINSGTTIQLIVKHTDKNEDINSR